MRKTIGIFGGLGPESTAAYYSYMTRKYFEEFKDYAYPEIVVFSASFQEYIACGYEAPDRAKAAIEALAAAGADFAVAACNSVHVVYDEIAGDLPIPWVSIMDAVAEAIEARGMKRVALLGTVFTMEKGFFQRAFDRRSIEILTPGPEARRRVNDIIYKELVVADVREESRREVLEICRSLAKRGAEGVVLGCTELPFLIAQPDTDIPVFDTTAIHAQKALDLALGR